MLRHNALVDNAGLDPDFILKIQLGDEEEKRMGVSDQLVAGYRAKHPGLFPEGETLSAIKAKTQGSKKRH